MRFFFLYITDHIQYNSHSHFTSSSFDTQKLVSTVPVFTQLSNCTLEIRPGILQVFINPRPNYPLYSDLRRSIHNRMLYFQSYCVRPQNIFTSIFLLAEYVRKSCRFFYLHSLPGLGLRMLWGIMLPFYKRLPGLDVIRDWK